MTFPLAPKTNTSTVERIVDWSSVLQGDSIADVTSSVTSGTITISNVQWTACQVAFLVTGGAVGENAQISMTVATAGGQTLDLTFSLQVQAAVGPYGVCSTTKAAILEMAAEELASAGYEFDHGAEEIASWLRKLDALMMMPPYNGLGYNMPASIGNGDQLDASGIPDIALQTVAVALAMRISPTWGKTMTGESRRAFVKGENDLRVMVGSIPTIRLRSGTPVGSGNRRYITLPFVLPVDACGCSSPSSTGNFLVDDNNFLVDG